MEKKKKNSRQKGAAGERELAGRLRGYGYQARRGQQYSGASGDADVVGLPGIHIECKRVEKLNIHEAARQAERDSRDGEIPAVFHRKNNHEWLVTMNLDGWMQLYREYEAGKAIEDGKEGGDGDGKDQHGRPLRRGPSSEVQHGHDEDWTEHHEPQHGPPKAQEADHHADIQAG